MTRAIDGDALIKKFEDKLKLAPNNKNAKILVDILKNGIDNMPTIDVEPKPVSTGQINEYNNGMVAMNKQTYLEYNRIAVENLPKRYIKKDMTALEYLDTLTEMHKNKSKRQFFKMFPSNNMTNEEKVAFVESWKEANIK